jgi:hypothetical protein
MFLPGVIHAAAHRQNGRNPAAVAAALSPRTRALILETPSNPLLKTSDIALFFFVVRGCRYNFGRESRLISGDHDK